MAIKITLIVLGIALIIAFTFFEKRMKEIFYHRSKLFYASLAAAFIAAIAILALVDFTYIFVAIVVVILLLAIAPKLVDKFYKPK